MVMPRRLTSSRDLISIHDPALGNVSTDIMQQYGMTLNIDVLGDLSKLPEPPTIFTCLPLRASLARLDRGARNTNDDWWILFATHVTAVAPLQGDLVFDGAGAERHISDDCRDLFPDKWIRDIAVMITKLANGEAPFAPPVGMLEMISMQKILHARSQEIVARLATVKISESQ